MIIGSAITGRGSRVSYKHIIFLVLICGAFFFYSHLPFFNVKLPHIAGPQTMDSNIRSDYTVFSSGCKIMEMNPFDESVKRFLKSHHPRICSPRMVKLENGKLIVDEKLLLNLKGNSSYCCYRKIYRVTQLPNNYTRNADWEVRYSNTCYPIPLGNEGVNPNHTFVKIECQESQSQNVSVEFHGIVRSPSEHSSTTKEKAKYWNERKSHGLPNPPSILIIGIDSASRMHMMRSLPETRKFLQQNDFIELQGYTKVGENTFPNIMAGLGGMELHNYSCWPNKSVKMDDCPFVWKNFSDLNYITAFLEDAPGIAIFNFITLGFVLPPVDYYMRPLTVAMHKHNGWWRSSTRASCVGGDSPTHFQANFIKDFVSKMGADYPYFLFSWFTSVGHDSFNGLKNADNVFLDLLSTSVTNSVTASDNTIIIFMSDHGYRFGSFRATFLGFYEESLPFFLIRLPQSLKKAHPDWYINLKGNSRQLTSPLDLHSTLKHTVHYAKTEVLFSDTNPLSSTQQYNATDIQQLTVNDSASDAIEYTFEDTISSNSINPQFRPRYSFFEFIPSNRTCESASIPQRYCMCGVTPVMSRSSLKSSLLGDIIISRVNYDLNSVIKSGQCVILQYSSFLYGREVGHGEVWNNFNKFNKYKDYIVAVEATPSQAQFESKIRIFENSTTSILGDITRINSYKGESDCVADSRLKNFCFCKAYLIKLLKRRKQKLVASGKAHNKTGITT